MDATDIKVLLEVGERISFECKKAENNIPKSVWETYSSFANTIGGIIVLGITENVKFVGEANHFEITGITNPQKLRKEFFDTLNSNKVNRNILTDSDVEIIDYEGVPLMCITVPQADYRQRPIYINGNMMNGAFKRNYEGDYHCTEEDVKAMIRDANDSGNDGILIEHYNIDDIDSATLNAYRNRFRTANPDHIWNDYDDKDFLLNIGAYIRDRNTRREGLTLAGLLVFGKGLSIRERFDNIRMDYLDFTNLEEESRWSDRLTYDGRWENNLYNFFMRVQSKLISDIKRPFSLKGMERNDDSLLHKAIREALTNLIIHADYTLTGVLKVEKLITENNIEEIFSYDALVIPGGFGGANFFKDKENEIFKKLIKYFSENNKIIVAICTAVINLIETREIKNKKVTTYLLDNKRYFNQLKKHDVIPEEKEIVVDKNLFTCSGPANALDLSLLILEKLTSKENVEIVKRNMFLK